MESGHHTVLFQFISHSPEISDSVWISGLLENKISLPIWISLMKINLINSKSREMFRPLRNFLRGKRITRDNIRSAILLVILREPPSISTHWRRDLPVLGILR